MDAVTRGTLYVVATPIGNLEDITLRALRVLREVSLIAAEDTRRTRILLNRYGIATPMISYHEHNRAGRETLLLRELSSGKSVALVSDAGTPGISDPGVRLVRAAIEASVSVVPIPGPTALTSALSVSGLPTERCVFEGFLPPRKGERQRFLRGLRQEERTLVFYESPLRVMETLEDVLSILGNRFMALCREITKIHEEVLRGPVSNILARLRGRVPRGEITLVIHGAVGENTAEGSAVEDAVRTLVGEGKGTREIARAISHMFGLKSQDAYRKALEFTGAKKGGSQ